MLHKISFKGVIIGAVTNVAGTGIWGMILGVYLAAKYQLYTLSYAEQMRHVQDLLLQDSTMMILNTAIGGGFSVLGGYIAARIAKHNELLNGTLSSFLCVLFVILAIGTSSMIGLATGIIANPILGFLGGYLRLRQRQR
jgi:hypothetical protein